MERRVIVNNLRSALSADLLDSSPATGCESSHLQIASAFMHREPTVADGEYKGFVTKLAMNNSKRFSHHRGKGQISQNVEAQFWNRLGSGLALSVSINILELT
jgi:hypothetical protein